MLKHWCGIKAGTLVFGNHCEVQAIRERAMSDMLCSDVTQGNNLWGNFDDEEIQIISDIGDLIMDMLIEELFTNASTVHFHKEVLKENFRFIEINK